MALTTAQHVLRLGGLDETSGHELFRDDTEAELLLRVAAEIPIAEAYISVVAPAAYASVAVNTVALLGRCCEYLVLQQLCEPLKARKVYGSHWPLDSEDSSRFEALLDTEWAARADKILNLFGAGETSKPIVLAGLLVGQPTEPKCTEQRLLDILYEVDPYIANSRLLRTAVP